MWEYNHTPSPDELYHYGIVGMKWGKRRAAARGQSYTYTSHSTKKYNKKAKEYKNYAEDYDPKNYTSKLSDRKRTKLQRKSDQNRAKADLYAQRAKRSAQHDRNMQKLADKTSTGSTVGAILLAGGQNTKGYMQNRAAGKSVGKSAGRTVVGGALAGPIGGRISGSMAKSKYIRQDELKKKR